MPANAGSNGVCRKLGFALAGMFNVECPKDTMSPQNDWRPDLMVMSLLF